MQTTLIPCVLSQMPIGSQATVTRIRGSKTELRKLMSLGLKSGTEVELLHHRGKGVVVRSMGTRIAIGESIAQYVEVCPHWVHQDPTRNTA